MVKNLLKKFLPKFLISWYHFWLAFLGALVYGFPGRKIKVIGVTGTKGKSTVVEFCHKIFQEAGMAVASLSSIRFKINEKEWPNLLKMTMPGRFAIQKFLREAVNSSCQYLILEVTSEGICQYRHKFIDFEAAVFTNLFPEHIESHGGFENYKKAKGKLFQAVKNIHIINSDDKNADYFLSFSAKKKYLYEFKNRASVGSEGEEDGGVIFAFKNAKIKITNQNSKIIDVPRLNLKLPGEFNVYNALAAVAVGLSQGISLEVCKRAVEKIEVIQGRMELVRKEPFKVIVDYAHIPDALEKVYQTLSTNYKLQTNKLICVLGSAGGGRDKWKRPKMGEIADRYCSEIIVTNEDPYDEDPLKIIDEVASGVKNNQAQDLYAILDRREAIKKALTLANPGDTVIITGKGSEPWMCLTRGKKIPWDDRRVVMEEFDKIFGD